MILNTIIYIYNNDDNRRRHEFERGNKDIGGVWHKEGWIWLKLL